MKHLLLYTILTISMLFTSPSTWGQDTLSYPIDTVDGKPYYRYTVERSVGLYRISVNFDVKQEEILQANPSLQKRGLRYGEEILIPIKEVVETKVQQLLDSSAISEVIQTAKVKVEQIKQNRPTINIPKVKSEFMEKVTDVLQEIVAPLDSMATDSIMAIDSLAWDTTATRLAILLPLQADAIKRDKNMDRFYDFYAGSLIAIYQAQAKGQNLEVFTYDIGRTTSVLETLLAEEEIHQMDAIIGPAYSQQVSLTIDSMQQDSIWILIPFISKIKGLEKYPNVLKFNPSETTAADTLARYLATRKDSVNCVLVEAKEGDVIPASISTLHKALKQYEIPQTTVSVRAILADSIDYAFVPEVENIIIFNTEKYANLQAVIPHLLTANNNYRITLYSHYSWQNEKIILPQIYTSVFAPEPAVNEEYDALYRTYFNHELASQQPRYDLLGYDLTSHLLQIMATSNSAAALEQDSIMQAVWEGTQANIQYMPIEENGGLENQVVHIIHL